MGLDESQIWTLTTSAAYRSDLRDTIDDDLGLAVNYNGTPDGAYTTGAAELAFRVDQGMALLVACLSPDTAPPQVLYAMATQAGITPRPAVKARVAIAVDDDTEASVTLSTSMTMELGGSDFTLVEAYSPAGVAVDLTLDEMTIEENYSMIFEADEAGEVTLPTATTTVVTDPPLTGMTSYYAEQIIVAGADAESDRSLRTRLKSKSGSVSVSKVVDAVLDVPGVLAASIVQSQGSIAVSVSGRTDGIFTVGFWILDAAQAIYDTKGPGTLTTGAVPVNVIGANGSPVTVYLTVDPTESVAVTMGLITDPDTITKEGAKEAARVAVEDVFGRLATGGTVLYSKVFAAVAGIKGIDGLTLTLDGTTANVTPVDAASKLVPVITSEAV